MEKLKHGDYVEGLTEEQYRELFELERLDGFCEGIDIEDEIRESIKEGFVCVSISSVVALVWFQNLKLHTHDFETFKQKCINTFGK